MLYPGIVTCVSCLHRYPRQRECSTTLTIAVINQIGNHLPGGMATDLVDNNLASSSRRSYTSFQKQYVQFCEHPNFNPLLATERQLVLFVAELAQRLSHSTVRSIISISGLTHADNSSLGDPPSNALRLQLAMKGLKK